MPRRRMCAFRFGQLAAVLLLILAAAQAAAAQSREQIARGKYIFGAAAGCGCHTQPKGGVLNAGGRKYDGPFGTVYSSNITPDPTNGIGKWTDEQIITATRAGRRPNGERLIPVHPYTVFNGMAEQDLKDVVAYLRSVPPSNKPTPPKKITVPDVVGSSQNNATKTLSGRGFEVGVEEVAVATQDQDGLVQEQAPAGDEKIDRGSTVTITVGRFDPTQATPPGATTTTPPASTTTAPAVPPAQ